MAAMVLMALTAGFVAVGCEEDGDIAAAGGGGVPSYFVVAEVDRCATLKFDLKY